MSKVKWIPNYDFKLFTQLWYQVNFLRVFFFKYAVFPLVFLIVWLLGWFLDTLVQESRMCYFNMLRFHDFACENSQVLIPSLPAAKNSISILHQVPEGHVGVYWIGGALLKTITPPGLVVMSIGIWYCTFKSIDYYLWAACLLAWFDFLGFHLKMPLITHFEPIQVTLQTDLVCFINFLSSHDHHFQFNSVILNYKIISCIVCSETCYVMQVRDIPCGTKGGVLINFEKIEASLWDFILCDNLLHFHCFRLYCLNVLFECSFRLLTAFIKILCMIHCGIMVYSMITHGYMTKFIMRSISSAVPIPFNKFTLICLTRQDCKLNPVSHLEYSDVSCLSVDGQKITYVPI